MHECLLMTDTKALLSIKEKNWMQQSLDTALDVTLTRASCRVARAEGLVKGAVEDILLVLGMLARSFVTAFITRCKMPSMMMVLNVEMLQDGLRGQQLVLNLMVRPKGKVLQDELHGVSLQSALDPKSLAASPVVGCWLPPELLGLRVLGRVMRVENCHSNERVNFLHTGV